jgi:hypothetical protein
MRTTIDIDDTVLLELKRVSKREGKALGRLASELLAPALAQATRPDAAVPALCWHTGAMGAPKVDLNDRDAVLDALDRPGGAA